MQTPSYPGVYVEEVSGGVRPLQVASTSTAAFVGLAEMGPTEATRITSWTEFQRLYGTFIEDSHLAHSVFQYFNNGGRQCYVVRVTGGAKRASVTVRNRAAQAVEGWTFSARSTGLWGNTLVLQIQDGTRDPRNEFKLSIRRQADPAVVPQGFLERTAPLEVFDDLSVNPSSPRYAVNVLAHQSHLVDAEVLSTNDSTQNGVHVGGTGVELPLGENTAFQVSLDGDGFQTVTLPSEVGPAEGLEAVAAAIEAKVKGMTPNKASNQAAFSEFTCKAEGVGSGRRLRLASGTDSVTSSIRIQSAPAHDATRRLRLGPAGGGWFQDGAAPRRPANADTVQVGDAPANDVVAAVEAGTDGDAASITPTTYGEAFKRLDNITDFSLLAVPGVGREPMFALGTGYCAARPLQDVFYLGEPGPNVTDVAAFRNALTTANSYGALYFPWIKALDPTGRSRDPVLAPPSGYIAGLYARIDASRGVWKAPAGVEASLNGAVGLLPELSDVEHGNLNRLGVNVIRRFPGTGIVAFGARTVSENKLWRYVPVRRTAIMLRTSIYYGIQWAAFEPNDEPLWSQLRLSVGSFMTTLFRQGAFQGATPSQGFFVKCDDETTTQADIDAGVVNVLVGFAPLKPAEFVMVKISQKAGLTSG